MGCLRGTMELNLSADGNVAATATDLVKTIYQLETTLPDSKQTEKILLNMDEEQKMLLQIIHDELG